jgi:hypothetical protein
LGATGPNGLCRPGLWVPIAAVAEVGIDIAPEQPKILTAEAVKASDVVITMGCGDTCPFYPGTALRGLGARGPRWQRSRSRAADQG